MAGWKGTSRKDDRDGLACLVECTGTGIAVDQSGISGSSNTGKEVLNTVWITRGGLGDPEAEMFRRRLVAGGNIDSDWAERCLMIASHGDQR